MIKPKYNILTAAFECAPLAKSGGLADVVSALSIEWKKDGHNPIIILPNYYFIDSELLGFEPTYITLVVPMGHWCEYATLLRGKLPGSDVEVYLLEHNEYYGRDGLYDINGKEFDDNPRRFLFYSRAIFEAAKALNFQPDIIHAHDFHCGYVMAFLKCYYRHDPFFERTAGVYTIHNLAYQGRYSPVDTMLCSGFGMKNFYNGSWHEYYGGTNYMKVGIKFADKITTVSPTYAQEIRSEYYGEGLHNILNERSADLVGILNGVDYEIWSPEKDPLIPYKYGPKNIALKEKIKSEFLAKNGLEVKENKPLISIVSRMTEQKGIDLLAKILEDYLWNSQFYFAIIGTGATHYQNYFNYIKSKYYNSTYVYIGYNESASHILYAASDFFLVPSRFEPCGLTQMYAMKYGTLPIVRSTGGLADTVTEFIPQDKTGNGFVFWNYSTDDLSYAINRALKVYHSDDINKVRLNAMNMNHSAKNSADK